MSVIVDKQEVIGWVRAGRTYREMVDEYHDRYGITTTVSMWSNYKRREIDGKMHTCGWRWADGRPVTPAECVSCQKETGR